MVFKDKLIELRKMKGWSQEELGNQVNVSRQTVSKWETGETTPEMTKLINLSQLFEIGLDELVTGEKKGSSNLPPYRKERREYEYKSTRSWNGVPLVHINLGRGFKVAKGMIAIGNIAVGGVAIGGVSVGLFSLGTLTLGLLSLGAFAFGLAAFGGICVGLIAAGGVAIGYLALGGVAMGIYAAGGVAIARDIGIGGYAQGIIAAGQEVQGKITFSGDSQSFVLFKEEFINAMDTQFPDMNRIIRKLFTRVVWEI